MLNSNERDGNACVNKPFFFLFTLLLRTKAVCFEFFSSQVLESEISGLLLVEFPGEYRHRTVIAAVD